MKCLAALKNKFGNKLAIIEKSKQRVYINSPSKEAAQEIVKYCFADLGARFSIASGVDTRLGVEILYHMAFDAEGILVSIRALAKKPELEMPSFTAFMPAANWIEREIHEMLGVNFIGHPNLEKLLLPDDWPNGVYPYRKQTFESEKENIERQ